MICIEAERNGTVHELKKSVKVIWLFKKMGLRLWPMFPLSRSRDERTQENLESIQMFLLIMFLTYFLHFIPHSDQWWQNVAQKKFYAHTDLKKLKGALVVTILSPEMAHSWPGLEGSSMQWVEKRLSPKRRWRLADFLAVRWFASLLLLPPPFPSPLPAILPHPPPLLAPLLPPPFPWDKAYKLEFAP